MTDTLPPTPYRALVARLHGEWATINRRPAALQQAAGWRLGISFSSLDDVIAATGFWPSRSDRLASNRGDEPADGPAPDDVMTSLLLAARSDALAARVVLQRLLPGLVGCARRWTARRRGGSAEAFDELLSVAWTVIREFPVERRPHHLASNLLRDSEHRAFRRAARRLLIHEPTPPHDFDLPAAPLALDAAAELAEIVDSANLLTDDDRRLLELVLKGWSQAQIAVELKVSERTVRNYRDSVVHRLRVAAIAA